MLKFARHVAGGGYSNELVQQGQPLTELCFLTLDPQASASEDDKDRVLQRGWIESGRLAGTNFELRHDLAFILVNFSHAA